MINRNVIPDFFNVGIIKLVIKDEKQCHNSIDFINERISYIRLNNIAVIGVYMPFNDQTKMGKFNLEIELNNVMQAFEQLKKEGYETLIIGDFNCDVKRLNSYDKIFNRVLKENELICAEYKYSQNVDHTYFKGDKRSSIDHVVVDKEMSKLRNIEIIESVNNDGDHHAIEIVVEAKESKRSQDIEHYLNIKNSKIKWSEKNKREYNNRLQAELEKFDFKINIDTKNDSKKLKLKLNEMVNKLQESMRNAAEIINTNIKSYSKNKRNEWWNEDTDIINENYRNAKMDFKKYKSEETEKELKYWKKKLKKQVKMSKRMTKENRFKKINMNFKKNNRNYWKQLSRIQNERHKTEVDIEEARQELYNLFNTKLIQNDEKEAREIVEQFNNEFENKIFSSQLRKK